jgi:hypothetical protein
MILVKIQIRSPLIFLSSINGSKTKNGVSYFNLKIPGRSGARLALVCWSAWFGALLIEADEESLSLLQWYCIGRDLLKSDATAHVRELHG